MAGIGAKIKEAAIKAARGKISGDNKGKNKKRAGGSQSGVDKAMRAVKSRLK